MKTAIVTIGIASVIGILCNAIVTLQRFTESLLTSG
jgi:hypothetical protein